MAFNMTQNETDMSKELAQLLLIILVVYLNTIVALLGIAGNAVNIRVIAQQGFGDGINISLFVLAMADIGALLTSLVSSLCQNPAFQTAGLPIDPLDFINLVGSPMRGTFTRITSAITTFITLERCLCVALPLKVKDIISNQVTAIVLCAIFITLVLPLVPFYLVTGLDWKNDNQRNRTVLGIVPLTYSGPADINVSITVQAFVQIVSYGATAVFTIILLVKLKLQSQRRMLLSGNPKNVPQGLTKRMNRTLVLVTTIGATYLVCYAPSIFLLLPLAQEGFSMPGNMLNIFRTALALCLLLESVNSTMTVLLYYSISTSYRKVFLNVFCVQDKKW